MPRYAGMTDGHFHLTVVRDRALTDCGEAFLHPIQSDCKVGPLMNFNSTVRKDGLHRFVL